LTINKYPKHARCYHPTNINAMHMFMSSYNSNNRILETRVYFNIES